MYGSGPVGVSLISSENRKKAIYRIKPTIPYPAISNENNQEKVLTSDSFLDIIQAKEDGYP